MAVVDITWLEENIFHRNLAKDEKSILLSLIRVQTNHKGDVIIREGEASHGLFVLYSGRVSLQHQQHGQPVRIATLDAGVQLGEMTLFNGEQASATVKALEDNTIVYHLSASAVEYLMGNSTKISRDIMLNTIRSLSAAMRNMNGYNAYAHQCMDAKQH